MKLRIAKITLFSTAFVAAVLLAFTSVNGGNSMNQAIAETYESTSGGKVIDLDGSNFSKTIAKGVVLVDFWAPWCGPCRVQIPIIEELAKEIGSNAVITKLNVDNNRSIAQQFNIRSIPTLLLFKDGKVVRTFRGVTQKDTLIAAINELL